MTTKSITIRIDEELKNEAERLYTDLGLNMTTALTAFIRQSVRQQAIPFTISRNIPNKETLEAFAETEEILKHPEKYKSYSTAEELHEAILNEV